MNFRETMTAQQAPDLYSGPNSDQSEPRWRTSTECDKGDGEELDTLKLAARTFPPGTKVSISEPECPNCGSVPTDLGDLPDEKGGWFTSWRCECDFDWRAWTANEFA
jgi:hypothetical protein